ncbi:MAG: putative integral rane protein, partial [Naasia sp.]|nr:putative integral rane protein [Naasia sp.]
VNPKTQDAVYRAVGRAGVVLIAEGPKTRTNRMLDEEKRKVSRILPNVPVSSIQVGPDKDSVQLHDINRRLGKFKRSLTKAEVMAVSNRLSSLSSNNLPIPKGIDPMKVRPQRMR